MTFIFADADPTTVQVPNTSVEASAPQDRLAPFLTAVPRAGKSIGHTSVVFRLDFDTLSHVGLRAAYKPESKRGHKRYRGEVAAYRLAVALHLPNVPEATVRIFDKTALRASVMGDARSLALFEDEVVDQGGRVHGALMPWIDKLEFIALESPAEAARWKKELQAGAELPEDRRMLDAQISTLIVFDALTGNWDRWSGGQIGIDHVINMLLFVDNDAAFFEPIPPAFAAQMTLLRGTGRFSRSLVSRLRSIDALVIADALGDEEPGTPLLSARAVADVDRRRKEILAIIDDKIAALGETAVLFFQ